MDGQLVGRRERKKRATRAALSEAALRLSVERGVDNVTVEQIADEADVSLRTFFNYFSSKEEAVVAGDVTTAASLVAAYRERPAEEPVVDALRVALRDVIRKHYADRERAAQLRAIRSTPSLLPHHLAAFVDQERELASAVAERAGSDVDDLYPALVAATVMAVLRVAVHRWMTDVETGDWSVLADLVDRALAQLAAGLQAPLPATAAPGTPPGRGVGMS